MSDFRIQGAMRDGAGMDAIERRVGALEAEIKRLGEQVFVLQSAQDRTQDEQGTTSDDGFLPPLPHTKD